MHSCDFGRVNAWRARCRKRPLAYICIRISRPADGERKGDWTGGDGGPYSEREVESSGFASPGLPRASTANGQEPNTPNTESIRLVPCLIKLDAYCDNRETGRRHRARITYMLHTTEPCNYERTRSRERPDFEILSSPLRHIARIDFSCLGCDVRIDVCWSIGRKVAYR